MVSCILPGLLHNNRSSLPLFTGLRAYCRTDWNGESAAFFQIVLSDGTPRGQLLSLTKQISQAIVQQVQPLEEWGAFLISTSAHNPSRRGSKNPRWRDPMANADELLELAQDDDPKH